MADIDTRALNGGDLRAIARRRLPRGVFDFVERGSEDDHAVASNRASFNTYRLVPAVLKDVSKRTLATQILGQPSPMPLVVAPTGAAGLMWHDLVRRIQAAGFEALMVTVDTAVSPNRECNVRNGFMLRFRPNSRNFLDPPRIRFGSRWA